MPRHAIIAALCAVVSLFLITLGLLLSASASAAPVLNATCKIAWDYSAADQERIDGFRFIANGAAVAETPADARAISCAALKLNDGNNTLHAVAFAGTLTSANSNALTFRYSSRPLPAPGKTRLVIQFPEPPK